MDEIGLEELIEIIITDKGGTPQQYYDMMDYIAFHETGAEQRMRPDAVQITDDGSRDGAGKGLFMFETGYKKGANSAINRTVNYLKSKNIELPAWLRKASLESKETKSYDVRKLNADQQKMLFLGNHRMHPDANFSKVWSGEESIADFWFRYHWAGTKDPQAKYDLFNSNITLKDSLDTVKAKEEELLYKKNMAPFLSDSNNVDKFSNFTKMLEKIFGKTSSLIKKK
tara:strand:+ start:2200 stop:2880 length:681 start_codon:yes stop_codon:yes gene_type:complete